MADSRDNPPPPVTLPVEQGWLQNILNKKYGTNAEIVNVECKIIGEGKDFGEKPIPMAKLIHGQKYEGNQQGLLILEFVEGRSFTFLEDNTVDQLKVLVGHMANLQAYGMRHGKGGDCLRNAALNVFDPMYAQASEMYPKLQAAAPDLFPFDHAQVRETVEFARKLMSDAVNGKMPYKGVICLADIQPNNILWKVDGDGNIKDEVAAFIDFQACHMGRCASDIAALICWGLPAAQRKAHEDEVLEHYHKVLSQQAGDKVPLSLPGLKQEYQQCLTLSMSLFIPFLSAADDMKQHMGFTDERIRELRKKVATILEDWVK